jgi:protein gp37
MAKNSRISWTIHTFNPWWGCTKISPGCTNCYAATFDKRVGGDNWKPGGERRFFPEKHWREPLKWNAEAKADGVRARVFCASMADVFEDHPALVDQRNRLPALIDATPHLDWLLLTKRPENILRLAPWIPGRRNIWPGVTVENAEHVWRADELRKVDAAVRFISYEPALGPIDAAVNLDGIAWVVAGDESGPRRRAAELSWLRAMRDRCTREGVAFHLKQWAGDDTDGIEGARSGKDGRGPRHLPLLDGVQHAAFPEVARG